MSTTILKIKNFEVVKEPRPYRISTKGLLTPTDYNDTSLNSGLSFHVIGHEFFVTDTKIIEKLKSHNKNHIYITGVVHVDGEGRELLDVKKWHAVKKASKIIEKTKDLWMTLKRKVVEKTASTSKTNIKGWDL